MRTAEKMRVAVAMGLALVLASASGTAHAADKKKQKTSSAARPDLVWPLPPEKPRIRFVAEIDDVRDVEPSKKASFFERVAGVKRENFNLHFLKPHGIATDADRRIYVTDSAQGLVYVLDRQNHRVFFLGRDNQVRLRTPLGIAVDKQGRIWVADGGRKTIYAFDSQFVLRAAIAKQGDLQNPTSVAVDDARQRLYVVDSHQHCVVVYDTEDGRLVGKFGSRGREKGQFNFPTFAALDPAGRIYVSDTLNFRVQVFDPDFKLLETWGSQGLNFGQFLRPKGIALDSFGNVYVADAELNNFQIFNGQRRLLMFVGGPGDRPGSFELPAGIHVDSENTIYVADQNNRRIEIFQLLNGETEEPKPATTAPAPGTAVSQGGDAGVKP